MDSPAANPICGIVMPISYSDDVHTDVHWREVLAIFEEAIITAELSPQPVWIASDTNIIQSKILKNLFENDIVLCDVSTLNPNVMLEFGMRLTTKKPTVVVAEVGTKLPFDTNMINTIFYHPSLRHSSIKTFLDELANELLQAKSSLARGEYRSFLEHFTFERIEPRTVNVEANSAIERHLDVFGNTVERLEQSIRAMERHSRREKFGQGISSMIKVTPADLALFKPPSASGVAETISNGSAFEVGSWVHHHKFGSVVAHVDGNKLEVDFDERGYGRKRVIAGFVTPIEPDSG